MAGNLFREALGLLDKKDAGAELSEEEFKLINTAIIPLNTGGFFPADLTVREDLNELAKIVEEEQMTITINEAVDRLRKDIDDPGSVAIEDVNEAEELGIGSLERVEQGRNDPFTSWIKPLPGETKD